MTNWPTVEECAKALLQVKPIRPVRFVVIHHTYEPNHGDWSEANGAEGIVRYWENETSALGWHYPLGAHFIVSPAGIIYHPFDLDRVVNASSDMAANRQGIAIEHVGNFDVGHDSFGGSQEHASHGLVGALLALYDLDGSSVRFHTEFNHGKTCPGTGITGGKAPGGPPVPLLPSFQRAAESGKSWAKSL